MHKVFFLLLVGWRLGLPSAPHAQSCQELFTRSKQLYEQYRDASILTPSQIDTIARIIDAALACPDNQDPSYQAYLARIKAQILLSARYYDSARQTLTEVLKNPRIDSLNRSHLYWLRGYLNFVTGSLESMVQDYNQALLFLPRRREFLQQRFDLLLSISSTYRYVYQYEQSERMLLEARRLLERHAELNTPSNRAAWINHATDQYIHAPPEYARHLPQEPDWYLEQLEYAQSVASEADLPELLTLRAHLYRRTGHDSLALEFYRQAYTTAIRYNRMRLAIETLLARAAMSFRLHEPPHVIERLLFQAKDLTQYAPLELPTVYTALGAWYESQNLLDKAETHYRKAIQYLEERLLHLSISDWAREVFASRQGTYRGLIRTYLRKGEPRKALTTLELSRGRQLRFMRQQLRVQFGLTDEERAHIERIRQRLRELQAQLVQDTLTATEQAQLQKEILQLSSEQHRMLAVEEHPPPDLQIIQKQLRSLNQVALVYFLDKPNTSFPSPPLSHVFVLREDSLYAIPLVFDQDSLGSIVSALLPSTREVPEDLSQTQLDTDILYKLYQSLVEPVESYLEPGLSITIVPDGYLTRLPFSMLIRTPLPPYHYTPEAFLLNHYTFSYTLSLSLLTEQSSPSATYTWDMLAMGRSHFTDLPDTSLQKLPPLPGVHEELQRLKQLFKRAFVALNREATEQTFLRESPHSRMVHLASHTLVNVYQPLQTYIVLSPDTLTEPTDGKLHLYEIQQRSFPADLVVLSSCNTASGRLVGGEGLMGLQYAFLAAGATSTLASLWPVSDNAWLFLMQRFYRYIKQGKRRDRAWRQARLDYVERHADALLSPFFWSPGILYGPPTPLFGGTSPMHYLYLILVLLLLTGFLWKRTYQQRSN